MILGNPAVQLPVDTTEEGATVLVDRRPNSSVEVFSPGGIGWVRDGVSVELNAGDNSKVVTDNLGQNWRLDLVEGGVTHRRA